MPLFGPSARQLETERQDKVMRAAAQQESGTDALLLILIQEIRALREELKIEHGRAEQARRLATSQRR